MKLILLATIALLTTYSADAQNIRFLKQYGAACATCDGREIQVLHDGNALIGGVYIKTETAGNTHSNIILIKINPDGDTLWTRDIGNPGENEHIESFVINTDSSITIAGNVTISGNTDALILTVDKLGNVLWRKTYGGANADGFNVIKKINAGFVVGGITHSYGAGNGDAWIMKLNSSGDEIWSKTHGGSLYDDCWDLETANDGFIFTGGTYSFAAGANDDAWINKLDTNGNLVWRKQYGLNDRVDWSWAIAPVINGTNIEGYVFTGVKNTEPTTPGSTNGDLHFVKIDLQGNVVWDQSINTPAGSYRKEGIDVQQHTNGDFSISGYMLTNNGRHLYIIRTNSQGVVVWDTSFGNNAAFRGQSLAHNTNGDIYVTGSWAVAPNTQFLFATRIANVPTNFKSLVVKPTPVVTVYPNPTKNECTIQVENDLTLRSIQVSDLSGRCYENYETDNATLYKLSLTNYPKGLLLLTIETSNGTLYKKIIHE